MTIFVDMDDVLADTFGKHIELYNKDFNENIKLEDIESGEIWENVPEDRKQSILDHVYEEGFFINLEPLKDSIEVMRALSEKHEVYIASAAMEFPLSLKEKSDWLDKYFPFIDWKHRILCGNKFILKGDLLIDDRSYNLEKFDGDTLLFTTPHNRLDKGFERVSSWKEIAAKLL